MKSLSLLASPRLQECVLLVRLHTLRNDPLLEVLPHFDYCAYDGCVVGICSDIAYK